MRWIFLGLVVSLGACNLSDPDANNGNNQNNTSNNANNSNNQGGCDPACENGSCDNGSCICDDGYAGGACDACDADFQDKDDDGVCTIACAQLDCGANGTCDDDSGEALCACDTGYAGDLCDACDVGYQDNDLDGTCFPTCETEMPDCGEAVCDDSSGTTECVCPVGTVLNGATCDIAVPADPAFAEGGWTPFGLATLAPADPGSVDPGVGILGMDAVCMENSGFSQTYNLADIMTIGLLRGRISYDVGQSCFDFCEPGSTAPAIRINNSTFQMTGPPVGFGFENDYQSKDFCLGEAFYGDDVSIDVLSPTPTHNLSCPGFLYQGIEKIDHLHFEKTDPAVLECPIPGTAINGDFEAASDGTAVPGWEEQQSATGLLEVISQNGSNVLHVLSDGRCEGDSVSSLVSVPIGNANAFRMDYFAEVDGFSYVQLGSGDREILDAQAAVAEYRRCIPAGLAGTVIPIRIGNNSPGGVCADSFIREVFADNLEVINDSRCVTENGFINGTFDRNQIGWEINNPDVSNGSVFFTNINNDRAMAIRGARCYSDGGLQEIFIPNDGTVNALEYTYRLTDDSGTQGRVFANSITQTTSIQINPDLPQTGATPATETFCFPPEAIGFPWRVWFTGRARGGGACADVAPANVEILDVKMVNAVCP